MSLLLLWAGAGVAGPPPPPPPVVEQFGAPAGFAHGEKLRDLIEIDDDEHLALTLILTL